MIYRVALATLSIAFFFIGCAAGEPPAEGVGEGEAAVEGDVVPEESLRTLGGVGSFCSAGFPPCDSGLYCVGGFCRAPGGPGAFCGPGFAPCASGLACVGGFCKKP